MTESDNLGEGCSKWKKEEVPNPQSSHITGKTKTTMPGECWRERVV